LRIYKFRSLQEPSAKPAHLQLVPSAMDSVTSNHIFTEKKMEKMKKKLKKFCEKRTDGVEGASSKKQGWSTSTYSGEVPEEIRWKGRDMNS
jgi:hypothetical protein